MARARSDHGAPTVPEREVDPSGDIPGLQHTVHHAPGQGGLQVRQTERNTVDAQRSHLPNTGYCSRLTYVSLIIKCYLSFGGLKSAIALAQTDGAFHCTPLQRKDKAIRHIKYTPLRACMPQAIGDNDIVPVLSIDGVT